ncbi:MAG: sulfite exporter TauE/SafE family protein [Planctomycetota bacterium]|nr:MAG: sulfite exporter TauE/SafE family protein [Planctomycetota bacterium]
MPELHRHRDRAAGARRRRTRRGGGRRAGGEPHDGAVGARRPDRGGGAPAPTPVAAELDGARGVVGLARFGGAVRSAHAAQPGAHAGSGGAVDGRLAWLGFAACCGFTTQATVGFGGLLVSLTIGAQGQPLAELLPVLVPVSLLLTGRVAWHDRGWIDRRLVLQTVLPWMGAGAVAGLALSPRLGAAGLRTGFGALVLLLAARELWRLARAPAASAQANGEAVRRGWVGLAGLVHGIYACGGPLLVYALGRSGLDKRSLRATLCAIFFTLNSSISVVYACAGRLGPHEAVGVLALAPVVLLAFALGNALHHRVDERRFRVLVYTLLVGAGLRLLLT